MEKIIITVLILFLPVRLVYAEEKDVKQIILPNIQIELASGAGREKVQTLCNICHSVDYITMQPAGTKAQWTATVTKMRKLFGAPISDADSEVISSYLAEYYGTASKR